MSAPTPTRRRPAAAACGDEHQRLDDQHHLHLRRQRQPDRGAWPHHHLDLLQHARDHHARHPHHQLPARYDISASSRSRRRAPRSTSARFGVIANCSAPARRGALDRISVGRQRPGRHAGQQSPTRRSHALFPQGPSRLDLGHHQRGGRGGRAAVLRRLGQAALPNGNDDPTGSITSQTTRGFTGRGELPVSASCI